MFAFFVGFLLVVLTYADEPILHLNPGCPATKSGIPRLHLKADVPAYALAKCKNGDKVFVTQNEVDFGLGGTFENPYDGTECQFYKKQGSNTYTVDVEVGWGEKDSQLINNKDIKTISCAYDKHGLALSATETIAEWFLNPPEMQSLLGSASSAVFDLQVVDVLGRPVQTDHISIGRKIRLRANDTTGSLVAFRALSCQAINEFTSYDILRAGCGDGIIFEKQEGFSTLGKQVYSPYFEAFRLRGSSNIQFQCTFTACTTNCDGFNAIPGESPFYIDLAPRIPECELTQLDSHRLFVPSATVSIYSRFFVLCFLLVMLFERLME